MAALSAATTAVKKPITSGAAIYPSEQVVPVAASAVLFSGAIVLRDALGRAKEPTGTGEGMLSTLGVVRGGIVKGGNSVTSTDADNTGGAAGDISCLVEQGIFTFANDTTIPLTASDAGLPCYVKDDATVSADSDKGNRAIAGLFLGLDSESRAVVAVGEAARPQILSFIANADLSSLQNTIVKLANASGAAKVASSTASTDANILGVLLNAPTSGAVARVVVSGPALILAGSAGWTAGDAIAPTTGGAGVTATAAQYSVGFGLETTTSGQSKMAYVRPGIVKA